MGTIAATVLDRIPFLSRFRAATAHKESWTSAARCGTFLLVATPIVLFYAILSLTAGAISISAARDRPSETGSSGRRLSVYLILRMLPPAVEFLHLPLHIASLLRGKLTPRGALWASSIMCGVWLVCLILLVVVLDFLESDLHQAGGDTRWGMLNGLRAVLAGGMVVLYAIYFCCACAAARRSGGRTERKAARERERAEILAQGPVPTTDVETAARELRVPQWVVRRSEVAAYHEPPPPYSKA